MKCMIQNFKYSVIVPTLNEQNNIERCLRSIDFKNEVIVIDSYSNDRTLEICKNFNVRILQNKFHSHGSQIMYASKYAKNEWIFVLDADETFETKLHQELNDLAPTSSIKAYKVKRINYFSNYKIKYGSWKNDSPTRLFNKNHCHYNDRLVHSSLVVDGKVGLLKNNIKHYSYTSVNDYMMKIGRFSRCGAQDLFNNGTKSSYLKVLLRSSFRFFKSFILYRGFLDGRYGFLIAILESIYVALKYLILLEMHHHSEDTDENCNHK